MILLCLASSTTPRRRNLLVALAQYTVTHMLAQPGNLFSIFHNSIRSLSKNLVNLQNHLLNELDTHFSIIGVSETRIVKDKPLLFNPNLLGYNFEHVPTPLSAGGVGLYINELIPYRVLEKESTSSFQTLWCELNMRKGKNIICGVVYSQHNCPDHFLDSVSSKLETLCARNSEIILLGDFNIDLLKIESCGYSKNFLKLYKVYLYFQLSIIPQGLMVAPLP